MVHMANSAIGFADKTPRGSEMKGTNGKGTGPVSPSGQFDLSMKLNSSVDNSVESDNRVLKSKAAVSPLSEPAIT